MTDGKRRQPKDKEKVVWGEPDPTPEQWAEAGEDMRRRNGPTLDEVIGGNLRAHRESKGWSRTYVAQAMGEVGFAWTFQTVGMVERGERPLTIAEMVSLPLAIGLPPIGLLLGAGPVRPTGALRVEDLTELRNVMLGAPADRRQYKAFVDMVARDDGLDPDAVLDEARQWWPECPQIMVAMQAWRDSAGEAEPKAAQALSKKLHRDVTPFAVALTALRLWSKSLPAKRDEQVAERIDTDTTDRRSLQAHRGHITRQLVAEMASILEKKD